MLSQDVAGAQGVAGDDEMSKTLELCEECESRNLNGTCDCTHCPECGKDKQCYSCATRGGWTPLSALQELERERTP